VANTINAGADIGAIAAAINLLLPIPSVVLIVPIALSIVVLQVWGSYRLIANTFKWLALALLAYVGAALFARPDPGEVLRATFVPTLSLDKTFLSALVAILGTTISRRTFFFWQSDQEVEEDIQMGRVTLRSRSGATDGGAEVRRLGCQHWHAAVQRGYVLHHPGHGRHAVRGWPNQHPVGSRCRRGLGAGWPDRRPRCCWPSVWPSRCWC
jgi:hypothetical protein